MAEPEADQAYQNTPETPPEDPTEPVCPPPPPETSGCEPGVDDLKCVAAGDKAKATYSETFEADLAKAKTDYETTRKDYRAAQQEKALIVQDLENQIRHLVERIKCQIEQKRVWKCLDEAFCSVLDELKCCPTPEPCCGEPCEFPLDACEDKSAAELATLIAAYQKRIDEAKTCFNDLLGEPVALRARVDEAKKLVDDLNAALGGDQATLDLKKLYAEAVVAQWKIERVWGSFGQVQKYVDCLCQALTCWTKGCHAVYHLTGAKAVAECQEQAKKDRCDKLRNETAEQVLAAYDRLCAEPPCEDEPREEKPNGAEDDTDDDCDCHKHHHHHHHHDCGCGCGSGSGGHHHHQGGGKDCGCHD